MKPKARNKNGYKICYKEKGKNYYVRYFLTYTFSQAVKMKNYFIRYPQLTRDRTRPLKKPEWVIIPIKKSEVKAGIWHEVPFWNSKGAFQLDNQ